MPMMSRRATTRSRLTTIVIINIRTMIIIQSIIIYCRSFTVADLLHDIGIPLISIYILNYISSTRYFIYFICCFYQFVICTINFFLTFIKPITPLFLKRQDFYLQSHRVYSIIPIMTPRHCTIRFHSVKDKAIKITFIIIRLLSIIIISEKASKSQQQNY